MMLPVSHSSSTATLRGYVVGVPSPSFAERRSRHRHVTVKAAAMSRFEEEEEEENRRSGEERRRRPRFLCLHGFRTSGDIMRQQVRRKWPAEVTSRLDLVFADAPYPAEGKSDVEGMFPPPYYEWFQFDKVWLVTFHLEIIISTINYFFESTIYLISLYNLLICPINHTLTLNFKITTYFN